MHKNDIPLIDREHPSQQSTRIMRMQKTRDAIMEP